jgi:hypothetical protein
MALCDHCNTLILFGGKRFDGRRFCSEKCLQAGAVRSAARQLAEQVPEELIQQQVQAVHQGECPKCGRAGPIDVHVSHRVWSAIHMTSWKSRAQVSCRACGVKSKCGDALFSLLFGWWGFPFGLVLTPIQIGRNIVGMLQAPDPTAPSPQLEQMVRADIAKRAAVIHSQTQAED